MICTGEDKMEDIAYNYIEKSGALQSITESLQGYFDYKALDRDMEIEGSYFMGVCRINLHTPDNQMNIK